MLDSAAAVIDLSPFAHCPQLPGGGSAPRRSPSPYRRRAGRGRPRGPAAPRPRSPGAGPALRPRSWTLLPLRDFCRRRYRVGACPLTFARGQTQPCQGCVKVALACSAMRDFLAATRDRVVVFDGGMGATLEQFDLSLEKDYRLPGRCHEALVLNRPGRHPGRARVDGRGGRGGRGDRHVPGQPAEARGVGPGRATRTRSTSRPRRSPARRSARTASSPARSARPASCPRPRTRASARSASASSSRSSPSSPRACSRAAWTC